MKKSKIRRIINISLVVILLLANTLNVLAMEIPGYEGGIKNEMKYMEVIFITGEPIILEGTIDIRVTERNDRVTERYTYKLENLAKNAKMTRTVNLTKSISLNGTQRVDNHSISSYKETIEINGVKYETTEKNVQWSKSDIYQIKPAVTYLAGNLDARKTYTIDKTAGRVTVEIKGSTVGYDQNWGTTETQTLDHFIQYETFGTTPVKWQATARVEAVHNRTLDYSYEANMPTQISFRGGYLLVEQQENVLKYSYDMPRLSANGTVLSQRNIGTQSFSLDTNPLNQRLEVPSIRDISGFWAEADITFLASMGAVYPDSTYYGPSLPMSRGDFARAVATVMGLVPEETPPTRQRSVTMTEEPKLFTDVSNQDPNYKYIKIMNEKGIMQGAEQNRFYPSNALTKAEAVAIMVRLLGFENLAPIQQYSTGFRDDASIPIWAKDYIYVAKELGLVSGNEDNYFQPARSLTKAEAARMMTNLIHYLQQELRYDYREAILNY